MIGELYALRRRIVKSHLAIRFLRGAVWSVIGSLIAQGVTLVATLLVARLLGKETYGQFVLIQSTLNMFGTFAGFGIGATATRYAAALRNTDKRRLGQILALSERTVLTFGIIVSLVVALFSRYLASNILNSPTLSEPLAIAALAVLFATLDGYQKSVLIGLESMRVYAISGVAGAMAGMGTLLIFAAIFGLDGAVFALTVSTLIQAGISRFFASRDLRLNGISVNASGCLQQWPVLRDFALPALLAGAMVTPAHWICQAMLANTENGFSQVAVLGVAMQWFNAILFLPMVAGRVVAPILTEYVTSGNQADSKRVLGMAVAANLVVSIPVAILISVFSPWILSAYGPEFSSGVPAIIIMAFSSMLVAGMAPIGNILAAHSKMWVGLAMNFGWFISYIAISRAALAYGAVGICGAMAIAYILHSVWVSLWTLNNFSGKTQNAR